MSDKIIKFWAKTSKDDKKPDAFHPLICHLIDVGTVAGALWENVLTVITKRRLAKYFGLENDLEKAGRLTGFLIGLHDLGKCSPPFTLRGEHDKITHKNNQTVRLLDLYKNTDCFCNGVEPASVAPHGFVTSVILPPMLIEKFGFEKSLAESISNIIGGHHGTFPDSGYLNTKNGAKYCGDLPWRTARRELFETLARLFGIEEKLSNSSKDKLDNASAMIFAGLTTVADWIGSNVDFFKCAIEDSTADFSLDLDKYFKDSNVQAEQALIELGWTNWIGETKEKTFSELFPVITNKRHLQITAEEIAAQGGLDAIGIAVIESPMGEGKTEAAMYLADTWNAGLGTRGIYFALPTQATSNQMFGRIKNFLEERFSGENVNVQLLLQHGHSSISAEFDETVKNFRNIQNTYDDSDNTKRNDLSNVAAAEWFTYRKKGLLVPFGVGTIDQILMSVLQTKHVFVRLFGLANKTVIIDEVHAYDAYMSTLLERLLEWLAALGSPVVILSATLPKKKRDLLIKAYLKGLGRIGADEMPVSSDNDNYPRISYATANTPDGTFKIRKLDTSPQNTKTLYLEWKEENNLIGELKAKLAGGGCAAIICNTVDKAQTLFARLTTDKFFRGAASDGEPKLDLLHARFRFKDREEREQRSLKRFGKPDENKESPHRPQTAVLIATQIIEQSLDIDFDLMISELAPADLLLQRAGRLQRHERKRLPEFRGKPKLWLIKPPTDANDELIIKKNSPDFGKSGFVYDKHILLRSWLKLKNVAEIEIPGDIENLIEDIYDDKKMFENLSESEILMWRETLEKYQFDCEKEKEQAAFRYIKHPHYSGHLGRLLGEPKEEDAPEIHPAHQATTRLVEPTVNVVCLWEKDDRLYTDESYAELISLDEKPNQLTTKKLLFNSLTVSSKSVVFKLLNESVPKGWEKSALLMRHRVLKFGANGKREMFGYEFHLDENLGLRITKI